MDFFRILKCFGAVILTCDEFEAFKHGITADLWSVKDKSGKEKGADF